MQPAKQIKSQAGRWQAGSCAATAREVGAKADRQCVQEGRQVYAHTGRRPARKADFSQTDRCKLRQEIA